MGNSLEQRPLHGARWTLLPALMCQGCGRAVPGDTPAPFRCPEADRDGGEHIVARALVASSFPIEGSPNPFERYRTLTHAHALAVSRGMPDGEFVALVGEIDDAVAQVAGHGFVVTPFQRGAALSEALGFEEPGGVWIKDETGNVSGSHKGRHLMGLAILGEIHARTGIAPRCARLAIASCGNAALAAAVIARALARPLDVFIPAETNPRIVAELSRLGAVIHTCARAPGVSGDPCYHAFRAAVAGGALPFCCQGSDNGLTVEGGETLAWEMVSELVRQGRSLDRLFVQVGGGALASACVQGFRDAEHLGAPVALPRIHAVQTRSSYPLHRAWERVVAAVADRLDGNTNAADALVTRCRQPVRGSPEVEAVLDHAVRRRSDFMWPWEAGLPSVAHGILDDETYDWLAIVRGMIESGGSPVVVDEPRLLEANALGRACTGIDVDATGTAGLAGMCELRARGAVGPHEAVAVVFSGVKR